MDANSNKQNIGINKRKVYRDQNSNNENNKY